MEKYMMKALRRTVENGRDKAYNVIHFSLLKFYGEYTPQFYERTKQILNSLVKSEVVSTGNGYEAIVYVDLGRLNHPKFRRYQRYCENPRKSGNLKTYYIERKWSEDQILDSVMLDGSHGQSNPGTAVWVESMAELDVEFLGFLKKELIRNGIPVR